uniref:Uncharacterized protein n=1 Tax=Oryza sativa subsp. japonica TaxID=39947 RepID=Q67WD1_ORYSJ|nr:hypothetical protein [Oryza sativa Japonica Group]BAD37538.1 hypothetical protein [Oryza sativa Japonica Group]
MELTRLRQIATPETTYNQNSLLMTQEHDTPKEMDILNDAFRKSLLLDIEVTTNRTPSTRSHRTSLCRQWLPSIADRVASASCRPSRGMDTDLLLRASSSAADRPP